MGQGSLWLYLAGWGGVYVSMELSLSKKLPIRGLLDGAAMD